MVIQAYIMIYCTGIIEAHTAKVLAYVVAAYDSGKYSLNIIVLIQNVNQALTFFFFPPLRR